MIFMTRSKEFVTTGSARAVSRAIEQYAHAQGHVSAIAVPWESSATTVSMSVTSVKADGWAIEHTNLGTILLTDRGNGTTAVAVTAHPPDHPDGDRLSALFVRFADQLQSQFETGS
jgi:hypothetical protein